MSEVVAAPSQPATLLAPRAKSCSRSRSRARSPTKATESRDPEPHLQRTRRSRSRSASSSEGPGLRRRLRSHSPCAADWGADVDADVEGDPDNSAGAGGNTAGLRAAEKASSAPTNEKANRKNAPVDDQRKEGLTTDPAALEGHTVSAGVDPRCMSARLNRATKGDSQKYSRLMDMVRKWLAEPLGSSFADLRVELRGLVEDEDLDDFLEWLEGERTREQSASGVLYRDLANGGKKLGLALRSDKSDQVRTEHSTSNPSNGHRALPSRSEGYHIAIGQKDPAVSAGLQRSELFRSNLAKLKAKADAEHGGTPPRSRTRDPRSQGCPAGTDKVGAKVGTSVPQPSDKPKGDKPKGEKPKGSGGTVPRGLRYGPGAPLYELPSDPIVFVPAQEAEDGPSKSVVVIDPRGQGQDADNSDDDEMQPGLCPGQIVPPVRAAAARQGSCSTATSQNGADFGTPGVFNAGASETAGGNRTLVVSDAARQEDQAMKEAQDKRKALEDSKKHMLAKLTKQLQTCLTRIQDGNLDEKSREKYQDMVATLKSQMAKVTGFK